MSPITHLMLSWLVAEIPGNLSRRDRTLITLAGLHDLGDGRQGKSDLGSRTVMEWGER